MDERRHYTRNGYDWTVIKIKDTSCLIIHDKNLYPDYDSRSEGSREFLFPINDKDDLKAIKKLFK